MASYPASSRPPVQSGSGAFYGAAALLLGLGVGVLAFFALMMWADARDARDTAAARPPRLRRRTTTRPTTTRPSR